jgi:hypothetical protein
MAIHTIIEINHDKAHLWLKDPKFGYNLYHVLIKGFFKDNILDQNERILRNYGIKVLNQHHSSKTFKLVEQP